MSKRADFVVGLTLLLGCSPNSREVRLQALDQPGDLAFICFEAEAGEDGVRSTLPLEQCDGGEEALHVVATQVRRGELATIELTDDGSVLDLDSRIPGFTFVEVGELPTAVVAPSTGSGPRGGPTHVYVASRGSRQITIIPASRLVRGAASEPIPPPVSLAEFGAVGDLILGSNGDRIYAAMPESGQVLEIAIGDGGGVLTVIGPVPLAVDPLPSPTTSTRPPLYCQSCAAGAETVFDTCSALQDPWPTGGVLTPRPPQFLGTEPRPVSFALDEGLSDGPEDNRILIADANLPVVHVLDAATGSVLTPLALSVPTIDLAVTPPVPVNVGSLSCVRYLYAIDAIDRSVLVADYPSGAVQAVALASGEVPDRLTLPTGAQALTTFVVTGDGEDGGCPGPEGEASASIDPEQFHGVFAAVATTDGRIRFIDLRDLDAERGLSCGSDPFYVVRHRPRLEVSGAETVELRSTPSITRALDTESVDDGGMTTLGLALGAVECDPTEQPIFGDNSRICAIGDPWAIQEERWEATWEGSIPSAAGVRGRFLDDGTSGSLRFTGELDFCSRGVLGERNATGLEGAPYGGDLLVLTGPVSPSFSDECRSRFLELGEEETVAPVALRVVDSFSDGLVLDSNSVEILSETGVARTSIQDVLECFGSELAGYELRVGGRYAVTGSQSGFLIPMEADASDIDPELGNRCSLVASANGAGRAAHGETFANGRIRFLLGGAEPPARGDVASLSFEISDVPFAITVPRLREGALTLPVNVTYNPLDRRLYALDIEDAGLVSFSLEPLGVEDAFQ